MSSTARSAAIVWHKVNGDLRVHDNEPLARAHESHGTVAHLFCFDPRWFGKTACGFPKTGPHRLRFMLESVEDLSRSLAARNSALFIALGRPEDVIPRLAKRVGAASVLAHAEVCSEEQRVEEGLAAALRAHSPGTTLTSLWGNTLYHIDDLPFPAKQVPNVYSQFRTAVERRSSVRPEIPEPRSWRPFPVELASDAALAELQLRRSVPTPEELGAAAPAVADARAVHPFPGGESAALARLRAYFWDEDRLKEYKATRNGLLGAAYSSKFAPWVAFGCGSAGAHAEDAPAEVRRYEAERVANDSTYWLLFEVIWRDFFRFSAIAWGDSMFRLRGPKGQVPKEHWTRDANRIRAWCQGQTGYPFIDANMRELLHTGFMSNRGRQNVASFLTKDLLIDWRVGAEWFESMLIDYDPCSNYGNWTYVAGVGADPREGRYFNVIKQSKQYDANADFARTWVPEAAALPAPFLHDPQQLPPAQRESACPGYPMPIVALRPPGPPRGGSGSRRGGRGPASGAAATGHADRGGSRRGKRTDTDAKAQRKSKKTSRIQHAL